jgi:hypothetical protein
MNVVSPITTIKKGSPSHIQPLGVQWDNLEIPKKLAAALKWDDVRMLGLISNFRTGAVDGSELLANLTSELINLLSLTITFPYSSVTGFTGFLLQRLSILRSCLDRRN